MATDRAPKQDPELDSMAAQIRDLHDRWSQDDVDTRVEIGQLLTQVRQRVAPGKWTAWIEAKLPFTPRQANNLTELHTFATEEHSLFQQIAPLGPSKLYVLIRLERQRLDRLLARRLHRVPSTAVQKPLVALTLSEFMEVIRALREAAPDPHETMITQAQKKVTGAIKAIEVLIEHRNEVPEEIATDVHDDLQAALAELAAAYEL